MEEGDNPYCAWGEEREKGTIANKPGQHSVHRPPSYLIAISFGKVWRHLKVIKEHTQQCMCMCIVGPWQSLQLLQRDWLDFSNVKNSKSRMSQAVCSSCLFFQGFQSLVEPEASYCLSEPVLKIPWTESFIVIKGPLTKSWFLWQILGVFQTP